MPSDMRLPLWDLAMGDLQKRKEARKAKIVNLGPD